MRTGKGHPVTCHSTHRDVVAVQLHSFLTLVLDGQHHDPATLSPGKNPATNCCGGRDGPRSVLDLYGEQNILLQPGFEPRTVQPVAIR